MSADPFAIVRRDATALPSAVLKAATPLLSWMLQLDSYRRLYETTRREPDSIPFDERVRAALGVRVSCPSADVARLPSTGPLVVAANHPHGLLDGLALAHVLRQRRQDVRVLTNRVLARIPELDDLCFFVDPFGGPAAAARSRAGLRAAHLWLKSGGALIVFPAGEVAHAGHHRDGTPLDAEWHLTAFTLAQAARARISPAFIAGTNSRSFYAAGHVHPMLRTALLPRELLRKRGQSVAVRIGPPMSTNDSRTGSSPVADLAASVRRAVEELAPQAAAPTARVSVPDAVAWEIATLPPSALLVESGELQVFMATARQIPAALREIGRLRERTYRTIGEGTGRSLDIDDFDDDYLHLFLWDRAHQRIVGAYRVGRTDRILAERGINGLYTRTLFRYDERLITRLSPALELGRSFVRVEYQKDYSPLLLLWKGIGQFVVRHPEYRILFGPVSISARYSDSSHHLLMAFLEQNHLDRDLAELVDAVNPAHTTRVSAPAPIVPHTLDEAHRMVSLTEADGKGVPVLLRQYLKLNARLLGFNIDPDFSDALDALMMVDLTAVSPSILNRYLGPAAAADFLAYHRQRQATSAA